MKNKITLGKKALFGLLLLVCMSTISAFAVSSSYWSGNPLQLNPGESRNFSIILQNIGGTSDLTLKAKITSGLEVLKITDSSDVYVVPAGGKKAVHLQANIPLTAEPGKSYDAKIDFSEVKQSSSGEFGFGTAIGQGFSVIVTPKTIPPSKGTSLTLLIALGIAVLLAAIFVIIKLKKKKFHRKKR